MKLTRARFTVRRWMTVVAVVAVVLAARGEFNRMEQRRLEDQMRELDQALAKLCPKGPVRADHRDFAYFEYQP